MSDYEARLDDLRNELTLVADFRYAEAQGELRGKTPAAIGAIIDALVEADGAPVPERVLLVHAELNQSWHANQVLRPAMHALELTGVVKRFTYTDGGEHVAYALVDSDGE